MIEYSVNLWDMSAASKNQKNHLKISFLFVHQISWFIIIDKISDRIMKNSQIFVVMLMDAFNSGLTLQLQLYNGSP